MAAGPSGPAASAVGAKKVKLTAQQRAEVKSLVEDEGYSRAQAIAIVKAGGL